METIHTHVVFLILLFFEEAKIFFFVWCARIGSVICLKVRERIMRIDVAIVMWIFGIIFYSTLSHMFNCISTPAKHLT